ncbi:MAG: glycosyltransferase family 39 protein [Thermoanaerobaculia bacterium]|nr:glycosyltransferase family 39 protein [Thermoanaerobaculia bacterium]
MSLFERLGLLVLGLVLFLPGIGGRDLWNPDEPRYAEVTREMRQSGDFFVPHLNGKIYSEKPPLLFWSIAAASLATGEVGPVAARLPSLAAAIVTLFLLFGMAQRLFDRRVAWWSVAILATSGRILWQARVGQIDMLLLCLVTLAMYFFVRGWLEHRPGFFRLFFVAAGLGTLAKGPVGLLPPLLSILAFAVLTRERSRLREMRIGSGLAIWAAVVLLWLVPAAVTGGTGYLETLVIKQNVTRYADPWHHFQPFYYYLTTVPADFLPWFFFLPGALWLGWRRATANDRRGYLFAFCWMAVTVLFFSLSPAKRTVYVLQMFPAMAMIVAWSMSEIAASWGRLRRFALVPAVLLAALFAALPLGWIAFERLRPDRAAKLLRQFEPLGPGLFTELALLVGILFAGALAAWGLGRRGHPGRVVTSLATGMGVAGLLAVLLILPRFDPIKSARPLSQKIVELSAPGEPYAIYPRLDPRFVFHTRRYAETPGSEEELRAFVAREGKVWLLITRPALAKLVLPLPLGEVARDAEREDGYVLLATGYPLAATAAPATAAR